MARAYRITVVSKRTLLASASPELIVTGIRASLSVSDAEGLVVVAADWPGTNGAGAYSLGVAPSHISPGLVRPRLVEPRLFRAGRAGPGPAGPGPVGLSLIRVRPGRVILGRGRQPGGGRCRSRRGDRPGGGG